MYKPGGARKIVRKCGPIARIVVGVAQRPWSRRLALSMQFSVYKLSWSREQNALVVKTFFKEVESPFRTQRKLRIILNLGRHIVERFKFFYIKTF